MHARRVLGRCVVTGQRAGGIDVQSVVTVDGDCAMSCRADRGEIQVVFGPATNGVVLFFDWSGLTKLLGLILSVITQAQQTGSGDSAGVIVHADEPSREAHPAV